LILRPLIEKLLLSVVKVSAATAAKKAVSSIRAEGGGFRAYTENGCVFADTAEEAILKHQERIKGRAKKGWPAKGKKKIK